MATSKVKLLFKDPILFLTLFAMIASTLISVFFVSQNYHKIDMLESEVSNKKMKIRELREDVNQQYNNVSVLVLLNFVANKSDAKTKRVKEKYVHILPNLNVDSSAIDILEAFEKERGARFNEIDGLYIDQVYLEKQQYSLEMKNKIYSAIAALLQVIGLALIIVRKDFSLDNLY